MDSNATSRWYQDKALFLAFFSVTLPFAAKKFGIAIDAGQLASLAGIVATYIAGHKWKSGAVLLEETRHRLWTTGRKQ